MFLDRHGIARSAGTYDSEEKADDAWKEAEKKVQAGKGDVLVRGRTVFRDYGEETRLPHLTVEVKTREVYTHELYAHLMAFFGDRPMLDIYTTDIKEWLSDLKRQGTSATTRKRLKQLLSSTLGSAVDDRYLAENPCLLVKTDPVPKKPLTIITPAQFDVFYEALPDAMSKLVVETAIETETRWGELTELRVSDWDAEHKAFTVCRAVVQVRPEFHPEGKRFFVKDYPKDGEYRVNKVAGHLAEKIDAHIATHSLKRNDLLFWYQPPAQSASTSAKIALGEPSGRTNTHPGSSSAAPTSWSSANASATAAQAELTRRLSKGGNEATA